MIKFLKKNKVVIIIFVFSISPIILNLFFFLTDYIAEKEVKWGEILYSSLSNEKWLEFWGTFMPALAAFSFLYFTKKQIDSIREQLDFEKTKYEEEINSNKETLEIEKEKYKKEKNILIFEKNVELELTELKLSKMIVHNLLVELDIADIDSCIETPEKYSRKIKKINSKLTAVDFLTNIRIQDVIKIDKKIDECREESYEKLKKLHELYTIILKESYNNKYNKEDEMDKEKFFIVLNEIRKLQEKDLFKITDFIDEITIAKVYNEFYNITLNTLLKYFYLKNDKMKYERIVIYNKEEI